MIEAGEPRLVEYNVRFGDPEAQVLAMRLGAQLLDACHACADRPARRGAGDLRRRPRADRGRRRGRLPRRGPARRDDRPAGARRPARRRSSTPAPRRRASGSSRTAAGSCRHRPRPRASPRRATSPTPRVERGRLARRLLPPRHRLARALTGSARERRGNRGTRRAAPAGGAARCRQAAGSVLAAGHRRLAQLLLGAAGAVEDARSARTAAIAPSRMPRVDQRRDARAAATCGSSARPAGSSRSRSRSRRRRGCCGWW